MSWIVDYLMGRPQYVRLQNCVSGAPQGTVLSPFLFTLFTLDFSYWTESCHLKKFSDDSAIVGCIEKGDDSEYRTVVDNFVTWTELNHLQLNSILKASLLPVMPPPLSLGLTWLDQVMGRQLFCSCLDSSHIHTLMHAYTIDN